MRDFLTHNFRGDRIIWMIIVVLFIFSMLAVYSSTGTLAWEYKEGNTSYYLFRHLKFLLFGLAITYLMHKVHYKYLATLANVLLVLSVFLLLITLFLGVTRNDATRWLTLPGIGISFQTSDFAKFALIIYIARILSENQNSEKALEEAFKPIMLGIAVVCGLILSEDFSTAFLLFVSSFILMFIGRIQTKQLLRVVGAGVGAVAVFILIISVAAPDGGRVGTWKARIENFLDNEQGDNYQADQAKIAIVTGGFLGKGPGNSTQRNFLPQPYSDFIYAIIIEEYGLAGGITVLALYLFLMYRTGVIARKSSRTFPAFLAVGLTLLLVFQALVNMAVAVNIVPVTGQPLPLVSMGGTSIMFTSIAFGIVLSISKTVEENE